MPIDHARYAQLGYLSESDPVAHDVSHARFQRGATFLDFTGTLTLVAMSTDTMVWVRHPFEDTHMVFRTPEDARHHGVTDPTRVLTNLIKDTHHAR